MSDSISDAARILKENSVANELLNNCEYAAAEPLLRQAVEGKKELNNAETWMWMRRLAECQVELGNFEEAADVARDAARALNIKFGPIDEDTLDCQYLYAMSLYRLGKVPEAAPVAAQAFEGFIECSKRGPDHVTTMKCKALYARTLKQSDPAKSGELISEITAALERPVAPPQGRQMTGAEIRGPEAVKAILAA
mmetsp:Transcript_37834/g.68379  ORF Transcript_37834/g.68379 Transcript_37834/m.68379 type:complete len:195 (+) Transcript_37834:48-632(+)|eukprot:CAMPEP_0197662354 /NCGR_PEP_ID=MMETSP1338-20131121/53032_1 /TAXON_ID=43686 ORGANISM="Pelagodinium beii, Strain RCC1491" /NCGR_SAMPLE_ID=MMETSP1338 /ASSEMBLY_ACC=CAM_ASM_000754 /LENGTH=194 /DNA_ID=CAMNT_0043240163 /DNA_START=32 /DNA_END=616 /DNA_ORIENTATION=+